MLRKGALPGQSSRPAGPPAGADWEESGVMGERPSWGGGWLEARLASAPTSTPTVTPRRRGRMTRSSPKDTDALTLPQRAGRPRHAGEALAAAPLLRAHAPMPARPCAARPIRGAPVVQVEGHEAGLPVVGQEEDLSRMLCACSCFSCMSFERLFRHCMPPSR